MKPNMKIGSFLLALMMVFTAVFAVGCVPTSLNKEWSYKTTDNELAIGVYIYSLNLAYSQAQTFAKDQVEDYSTENSNWLDEKIKDDDDNEEVAKDWIKQQAEKMCLSYLAIDEELAKNNVEISTDDTAMAEQQAKHYWDLGQYADYGYIMPMSKDLEPYGISFESFAYCTTLYSVKYSKLFDNVYGKDGSQAVSDDELTKFFTENYADYSYFSVPLSESSTDEAGQSKTVALSEEAAKKITDELDGYASKLNNGTSYDDVIKEYMEANSVENDPTTSNVENMEKSSIGEELVKTIKGLDSNKATTLKVGEGDSATYYLVYKKDINNDVEEYIAKDTNRGSVLSSMKSDDFKKYVEDLAKNLDYEANTAVLDQYKPDMFFVKQEATTSANG